MSEKLKKKLGVKVLCLLQRQAPSGCPLIFALADAVVLRGRACRAPAPARAWGFLLVAFAGRKTIGTAGGSYRSHPWRKFSFEF